MTKSKVDPTPGGFVFSGPRETSNVQPARPLRSGLLASFCSVLRVVFLGDEQLALVLVDLAGVRPLLHRVRGMVDDGEQTHERGLVAGLADRARLRLVIVGGADEMLPVGTDLDRVLVIAGNVEHPVFVELAVEEGDLPVFVEADFVASRPVPLGAARLGFGFLLSDSGLGGSAFLEEGDLAGRARLVSRGLLSGRPRQASAFRCWSPRLRPSS